MSLPQISIVLPVYNESENMEQFYQKIVQVIGEDLKYELIYVDDGSQDGTSDHIFRLCQKDARVLGVFLKRNRGQQNALYVGLQQARGEAVIFLDGDGQFDATCIPILCKTMAEKKCELVSGVRVDRQDLRRNRWVSQPGNVLINNALGISQTDFGAVKILHRTLINKILSSSRYHLVHPYAMAYYLCTSYDEVPVQHHRRAHGVSKWSLFKRVSAYLDIVVSFHPQPFFWLFGGAGFLSVVGLALALGIVAYRIYFPQEIISGLIIFFACFLVLTAVVFGVLAIVGDFTLRIYRNNFALDPTSTVDRVSGREKV